MKKTIEQAIADSKNPRAMDYLSQGFNFVFSKPGPFIGCGVIILCCVILANLVPFFGFVNSLLLQPVLILVMYILADKVNYQEQPVIGDAFASLKGKVLKVLLINLLLLILVFIPMVLFGYGYYRALGLENLMLAASGNSNALDPSMLDLSVVNLLLILGGLIMAMIVGLLYVLSVLMFWFKKLTVLQSLAASRKLVGKHFGSFFLLMVMILLINVGGALMLLLGLLFTLPASYCAIYIAFDDLVGARDLEENDEEAIMSHFISEQ